VHPWSKKRVEPDEGWRAKKQKGGVGKDREEVSLTLGGSGGSRDE